MNSGDDIEDLPAAPPRMIFLFIDGLGLRDPAPDNPVNDEVCPCLCSMIRERSTRLDAALGVPGAPQSATGQASLFTGVNTQKLMGRHMAGFPGPKLREIVQEGNIFTRLARRGVSCKFANGYSSVKNPAEVAALRWRSVTTVMALTEPDTLSFKPDLLAGRAVAEDITRDNLRARGVVDVPPVTPEEAAGHLLNLSSEHPFALYEYFQTDRAGHSLEPAFAQRVLGVYDRFLREMARLVAGSDILLVITSDHGNIEDMGKPAHTFNPVPLITLGPGAAEFRDSAQDLTHVLPAVLNWFEERGYK